MNKEKKIKKFYIYSFHWNEKKSRVYKQKKTF